MKQAGATLRRAQALDRAGRSRAACALLRAGISRAGRPGESLELARHLAHQLIRDGREREYLREFQRHRGQWATDGYLVFSRGMALHHFDRLHGAEAAYREALRLSRESDSWYAITLENLDALASELERIRKAGSALLRARLGIGLGLLLIGLGCLLARRSVVGSTQPAGEDAAPG